MEEQRDEKPERRRRSALREMNEEQGKAQGLQSELEKQPSSGQANDGPDGARNRQERALARDG